MCGNILSGANNNKDPDEFVTGTKIIANTKVHCNYISGVNFI